METKKRNNKRRPSKDRDGLFKLKSGVSSNVNFDDDFGYIKTFIDEMFTNEMLSPNLNELGKERIYSIMDDMRDDVKCKLVLTDLPKLNRENAALRYYAEEWIKNYSAEHGKDGTDAKLTGMLEYMIDHFAQCSFQFTDMAVRTQPFIYIHNYIIPRLFILADVDNQNRVVWQRFRSMIISMIKSGNDYYYKNHCKDLFGAIIK